MKKVQHGFSLIELAIVLVIVTILLGGLAVPLSAQIEARRIAETRKIMEEAREAIMGYAMSRPTNSSTCLCTYTVGDTVGCPVALSSVTPLIPACSSLCPTAGDVVLTLPSCPAPGTGSLTLTLPIKRHYLPCPDTDGDGAENRATPPGTGCSQPRGYFPWRDLGTGSQDAWGNRLLYAVAADLANSSIGFHNGSVSGGNWNQILSSTAKCNPLSVDVAADVPVVLISHGPNSRGARNVNIAAAIATPAAPATTSANELQNLGSSQNTCTTRSFISTTPSDSFDDLVTWLPFGALISRVCPSPGGCPP